MYSGLKRLYLRVLEERCDVEVFDNKHHGKAKFILRVSRGKEYDSAPIVLFPPGTPNLCTKDGWWPLKHD